MLDLTSTVYRFRRAKTEGDLFAALGVAANARNLDIDVAGAQLAEHAPWMAQEISAVVNLLTHQERRAAYEKILGTCQRVMAALGERYGAEFVEAFSDYRADIWQRTCRLFRFDLDGARPAIAPRGAESLARQATEWLIAEFLCARLRPLAFTEPELRFGSASRDLWRTQCACGAHEPVYYRRIEDTPDEETPDEDGAPTEFKAEQYTLPEPTCPRCDRPALHPSRFDERYTFALPAGTALGSVVRGEGARTGNIAFAFVNAPAGAPCPAQTLQRFYAIQQQGRDTTFDHVARIVRQESRRRPERPAVQSTSRGLSETAGKLGLAVVVLFVMAVLGSFSRRDSSWRGAPVPPPFKMPDFPRTTPSYPPFKMPEFPRDYPLRPSPSPLGLPPQGTSGAPRDSSPPLRPDPFAGAPERLQEQIREALKSVKQKERERIEQSMQDLRKNHNGKGNPSPDMKKILDIEQLLRDGRTEEASPKHDVLHTR